MTDKEQKKAAAEFAKDWQGKGDEKQDTQKFWTGFLRRVLGVDNADERLEFEKRVKYENSTTYIDVYIPETKVLIEQKSLGIDLDKEEPRHGKMLTPFKQAEEYSHKLINSQKARYIIVSNFETFRIHDLDKEGYEKEYTEIKLCDLASECQRLDFIIDSQKKLLDEELQVSIKAGELVGKLYDALLKQYKDPESEETLKSLNVLCVRLVFCLYAEDAGIFGDKDMFGSYLKQFPPKAMKNILAEFFEVLNTKPEDRDPEMDDELAASPYVNGGLFYDKPDEKIKIPQFTEEIVDILVNKASAGFDWSQISPTIFGAVFESTLNPETRRSGGMHYTSIENIHKVIDPLFLDSLKTEFEDLKQTKYEKTRKAKLEAFRDKLASLIFLDPACGSGNFLTETYISLRRLENQVLTEITGGQVLIDLTNEDVIKVGIGQFYGIEINDFAVTVAKTALWIAESQMMRETENIIERDLDFLPLRSYANITEGNALRLDWESVVSKDKLSYIMGNPPFVGYSLQSKEQKNDILCIYTDEKGKPYKTAGKIDYVSGWYFKAAQLMYGNNIRTAFVSTNSITQGEQVAGVWKPLYDRFDIHIDFAYRTFRWDSEANQKAHVHCVIVGFSSAENKADKRLFDNDMEIIAKNINPFLVDAPNVFIESRSVPICDVPKMTTGNRPADGGHLIIEKEDHYDFIKCEPNAEKYIKRLTGAREFINNQDRYCLWLVGVSPAELKKMPLVLERVKACKEDRLNGADDRKKLAETPTLFREQKNPETYIIVPATSSENRIYVPLGFLDKDVVPTNSAVIIPDATIYHFGILTSNVHMAWMRTVCGRLKSDYRYSKDIVYNNFPWCTPTDSQKEKIAGTAQGILDARAKYPDCSLADLYDETTMPPELRKAHEQNDKAVIQAYGFKKDMQESEIVAKLMEMYRELTE